MPEKLMCKAFKTTDPDLIKLKIDTPTGKMSGIIRTALRLYLYIKKHQPHTPVEKIAEQYRHEFLQAKQKPPVITEGQNFPNAH